MKTAGSILEKILDSEVFGTVVEYAKLQQGWNGILLEAFVGKKTYAESEEEADFSDDADTMKKVNAAKLCDHTKVKSIKQGVLLVETDHPGWMQILQSKRLELLALVKRRFPALKVLDLQFTLMKE